MKISGHRRASGPKFNAHTECYSVSLCVSFCLAAPSKVKMGRSGGGKDGALPCFFIRAMMIMLTASSCMLTMFGAAGVFVAAVASAEPSVTRRALKLLEAGDSHNALILLQRAVAKEGGHDDAQVQVALAVAALAENRYKTAASAARRAMMLKPGRRGASIAAAARPVLGASLLNLGFFKDASKIFSRLLKTGGDNRFLVDMHTVKLYVRARCEGAGEHERTARDLLKYCKARFSQKRKNFDRDHMNRFACFESVGKAFTHAGNAKGAADAFRLALRARKPSFRKEFEHGRLAKMFQNIGFPPEDSIITVADSNGGGITRELSVQVISRTPQPTVFVIDDFLTIEEQERLRKGLRRSKHSLRIPSDPLLCLSNVHPLRQDFMDSVENIYFTNDEKACANASALSGSARAKSLRDKLTWSSSAFIESGDSWLEEKIQKSLGLDPRNAYPTQLLEYSVQKMSNSKGVNNGIIDYKKHMDCSGDLDPNGRAITLLIYLTSSSERAGSGGGDTVFPRITVDNNRNVDNGDGGEVSIRPVAGRLVVFSSLTELGFCNPESQHYSRGGGFAVGESKIAVQKWYTLRPQRKSTNERNLLAKNFLKGVKASGILQDGQAFVSCDGSGSCREFVPWVDSLEDTSAGEASTNEL